jgi:hypothetical protein
MLGISGANLRRERLNHSLATIGIMAHELRTPLVNRRPDRRRAAQWKPGGLPKAARAGKLEKLGQRLNVLTRSMNHHIDMQIANARLLQLAHYQRPCVGSGAGHRYRRGVSVSLDKVSPNVRKSSSIGISIFRGARAQFCRRAGQPDPERATFAAGSRLSC